MSLTLQSQIGHFKGNFPIALKTFLANPQVLKAGIKVTQDLRRLGQESKPDTSYVGALELAKFAKDRNVISD
jgi:succinylglutamate desuccinylase